MHTQLTLRGQWKKVYAHSKLEITERRTPTVEDKCVAKCEERKWGNKRSSFVICMIVNNPRGRREKITLILSQISPV